ncbi:MAG: serine/threonine-protein kinase [Acidobacteriota bacterium]
MTALPPGSRIGRFEISGVLGEGAMGIVYLAHDPQIERPVAVKTLRAPGGGAHAEELESRFLKEAKLAGRLQHPNVVTIYEAGEDGTVLYIAMEYVDGEPLTRYLASRASLTLGERIEIVREAALALQHAHERGVLHRDVKPGNILVTRDRHVKVADFGIGKLLSSTAELTRTGQMIGSPAYMSPEQIRGEKLDGRSDFFSLGVVFYELLTGARPFPGDSITTLVYQILHTEPRDPLAIRADLPPAARDVFIRLLAKSPDKRPADAAAFLREIARIADQVSEGEPTLALPAQDAGSPTPGGGGAARAGPPASGDPAAGARGSDAPDSTSGGPGRRLAIPVLAAAAVALVLLTFFLTRPGPSPPATTPPPAATAAPAPAAGGGGGVVPAVSALPTQAAAQPAPTVEPLPTAGPAGAAAPGVGAPRSGPSYSPTRAARSTPEPRSAPVSPALPAAEADEVVPGGHAVDNVYRTRRWAKFGVSPDQARMFVDGRYVGIADDWDDRGGGRKFEFAREGRHRVRFELPGHRDLNLEVLVTPSASDDTVDVGDDLHRESKVAYPKVASVADQTVGPVTFQVEPPDATVSEGSRVLGRASTFGPSSPLELRGPLVHDLVLAAPGYRPKSIRILVGPTADHDSAIVREKLKKE